MKISIPLLMLVVSLSIVSAAPAPWGIAIKNETRECAGHWPGDEYVAYTLLPGWKAYFPDNNDIVNTEYGSCEFRKSVGDAPGEEEKCCKKLGLTFVSKAKIDSVSYPYLLFLMLGSLVMIAFLAIIGLIIFLILRKIPNK